MLARAALLTSSILMLAVTAIAPACSSGAPAAAVSDGSRSSERLVDARPLESDDVEQVALTGDADTSAAMAKNTAPCDGELDGAAMVKRANAFFLSRDDDGGVACLDEALTVDPQDAVARAALVKHYLDRNDGKLARVHAEELVRQQPLDDGARQMLGRALLQEKMWKEAIDAFALVVKSQPDNIYAHNNIGFAALQINRLELAREHLEHCLSLSPQQGYMLNNLGVTYERLGRFAEAHAAYSRAAELAPKYVQAVINRDRLQAMLGQDDRILSAETLLRLREPVTDGVVDGGAHGADSDEAPVDDAPTGAAGSAGSAAVDAAVRAAVRGTGG